MNRLLSTISVLLLLLVSYNTEAHSLSTARLLLMDSGTRAQLSVPLRDLHLAVGLDQNNDLALTWDEIRRSEAALQDYLRRKLALSRGSQRCGLQFAPLQLDDLAGEPGAFLAFSLACDDAVGEIHIDYRLLFDIDPRHRAIVSTDAGATAILSAADTAVSLNVDHRTATTTRANRWRIARDYFREGIWHIWIGIDHILFLLALLLPLALTRQDHRWSTAESTRRVLLRSVSLVTAFTVAHSITLVASTLGVVQLPARPVEIAIALSVVLAALNNLVPLINHRHWAIGFGFGLLHGFGFSSALTELGLPDEARNIALFTFNVGVEVGQLAIVAVFLVVALPLRNHQSYRRFILPGCSLAIAAAGSLWVAERAIG